MPNVSTIFPLRQLFDEVDQPGVEEILINGPGPVWVERSGALVRTSIVLDPHTVELLVEHIVAPLGLQADRANPVVDARLVDGSRVNIVMPPLALGGPTISIRRFPATELGFDAFGPAELAPILQGLVDRGASILVVGPTSSGKTSVLAALASQVPGNQRLVVIEDSAELPLTHPHLVRLETRPANSEGVGEVTMRRLVLTALRMRPDRLIVGEVRGAEAFDLLLALTSGHRGCLTTCHAAGVEHGLRRLVTLAGLAGSGLSTGQLRELVVDGLDAVIVTGRSGRYRGVRQVVELRKGGAAGGVELVELWPVDR